MHYFSYTAPVNVEINLYLYTHVLPVNIQHLGLPFNLLLKRDIKYERVSAMLNSLLWVISGYFARLCFSRLNLN